MRQGRDTIGNLGDDGIDFILVIVVGGHDLIHKDQTESRIANAMIRTYGQAVKTSFWACSRVNIGDGCIFFDVGECNLRVKLSRQYVNYERVGLTDLENISVSEGAVSC